MDNTTFDALVEKQLNTCALVLCAKAEEYAAIDDRLHNFKAAAALQDISPREALAGMMAKHTISIYDMLGSDYEYTDEVWDEKITDSINYLILLKALNQDTKPEQLPLWKNSLETALTSVRKTSIDLRIPGVST